MAPLRGGESNQDYDDDDGGGGESPRRLACRCQWWGPRATMAVVATQTRIMARCLPAAGRWRRAAAARPSYVDGMTARYNGWHPCIVGISSYGDRQLPGRWGFDVVAVSLSTIAGDSQK